MRLDKLIEQQLHTTRKEMKRLFLMGKVEVDGQKIYQENRNVDTLLHQVVVDNQSLLTDERYFLLHKPSGYVTANKDELPTVFDLLDPKDFREGLTAVGRLDRDTTGLLLLTSNGQLGYDLLQPGKKVHKTYEVVVNGFVTDQDIQAFERGIEFIGGVQCLPAKVQLLERQADESRVFLTITEGKFHQVKKMFLATGKKVTKLKRIQVGPLVLGDLPVGEYRPLTREELGLLAPYFR